MSDPIDGLQKLKTMLEMGLVSQEEFAAAKAEIMSMVIGHSSTGAAVPVTQPVPDKTAGGSSESETLCPFCVKTIRGTSMICNHCGTSLETAEKRPGGTLSKVEEGKYMFTGSYSLLFKVSERALLDFGMVIVENAMSKGMLKGQASSGALATLSFFDLGSLLRLCISCTPSSEDGNQSRTAQIGTRIEELVGCINGRAKQIRLVAPESQTTDLFAILSFATGMLGFFILPMVFVPVCYISSIVSYYRLKENPNLKGKGLRLIGALLGAISMLYLFLQLGIIHLP